MNRLFRNDNWLIFGPLIVLGAPMLAIILFVIVKTWVVN